MGFLGFVGGGSSSSSDGGVKKYTYRELETATNSFDDTTNLLGSGDFGKVYQGIINGQMIAVKLCNVPNIFRRPSSDKMETELGFLSSLNHQNIIKLLGCAKEDGKECIVYELMPKRSLKEVLAERSVLPLEIRIEIALGVAEALYYLHNAAAPVCHGDIKDSVVLLDNKFYPKLSGFGGSKLDETGNNNRLSMFERQESEWVAKKKPWDVLRFGKVLLQLITGRQKIYIEDKKVVEAIIPWAHRLPDDEVIDPFLKGYPVELLGALLGLARKCTDDIPGDRPTIDLVLAQMNCLLDAASNYNLFQPNALMIQGPPNFVPVQDASGIRENLINAAKATMEAVGEAKMAVREARIAAFKVVGACDSMAKIFKMMETEAGKLQDVYETL